MSDQKEPMKLETWRIDRGGELGVLITDDKEDVERAKTQGHRVDHQLDEILPVGTAIRSIKHPELTGRIKCYEWRARGELSLIPYNIMWDDDSSAQRLLGWFWIYASPGSIEPASPHQESKP